MQYYHVNVWHMGLDSDVEYTTSEVRLCSILAWQLPRDSRVWRAMDPAGAYDTATLLLRQLEYDVRAFNYGFSKDAEHKRNQPEPITLPGEEIERQRAEERADAAAAELARAFGLNL